MLNFRDGYSGGGTGNGYGDGERYGGGNGRGYGDGAVGDSTGFGNGHGDGDGDGLNEDSEARYDDRDGVGDEPHLILACTDMTDLQAVVINSITRTLR